MTSLMEVVQPEIGTNDTTNGGVQPEVGKNDTIDGGVQPEVHVVQTLNQEQQSDLFIYFWHTVIIFAIHF